MRNEERIEQFRTDDIAINCETKQEAKQFLDWCYENGMEWHASIKKVYSLCWQRNVLFVFNTFRSRVYSAL